MEKTNTSISIKNANYIKLKKEAEDSERSYGFIIDKLLDKHYQSKK